MKHDGISIEGSNKFIRLSIEALDLIKEKSKKDYNKIKRYLKTIKQSRQSGMDLERAQFNVSSKSASHSPQWYSSIIVHDVHHYYLHHVKKFLWEKKNFSKHEYLCFDEQIRFFKKIKAQKHFIDYIKKCYKIGHWRKSFRKRHKGNW